MRLGRSSSARSAGASCAAWFDRTNAPRARQPGGAGQTTAGPGRGGRGGPGRSRRACATGRAGRGCRRYEEQTSSQTHGRDITSSIFFSVAFFFARARMPAVRFFQPPHRAPREGKSICMIPASLSSCYAGRGGKTKTEGLQYLEPMGNVLLGSPGELLTLRRHLNRWCTGPLPLIPHPVVEAAFNEARRIQTQTVSHAWTHTTRGCGCTRGRFREASPRLSHLL